MVLKNFVAGLLFVLLPAGRLAAQFVSAQVGINGLTCSQCSRSVEMQLRRLSFVRSVTMDLEHTVGTLTFTDGSKVDVKAVAKAVKDAGFSVRFLEALIDMDKVTRAGEEAFYIGNAIYTLNEGSLPTGKARFRFFTKSTGDRPAGARYTGARAYYTVSLAPQHTKNRAEQIIQAP